MFPLHDDFVDQHHRVYVWVVRPLQDETIERDVAPEAQRTLSVAV